jgi:hypothetical protein
MTLALPDAKEPTLAEASPISATFTVAEVARATGLSRDLIYDHLDRDGTSASLPGGGSTCAKIPCRVIAGRIRIPAWWLYWVVLPPARYAAWLITFLSGYDTGDPS